MAPLPGGVHVVDCHRAIPAAAHAIVTARRRRQPPRELLHQRLQVRRDLRLHVGADDRPAAEHACPSYNNHRIGTSYCVITVPALYKDGVSWLRKVAGAVACGFHGCCLWVHNGDGGAA